MPTYEYRCKSCDHQLEVQQAFTDDPLTECPECQGPLRKVYGNVGISFKGSGFYKNDARGSSKGSAKTGGSGDASSTSDSSSSSSSSDTGTTEKKAPAAASTTTSD